MGETTGTNMTRQCTQVRRLEVGLLYLQVAHRPGWIGSADIAAAALTAAVTAFLGHIITEAVYG